MRSGAFAALVGLFALAVPALARLVDPVPEPAIAPVLVDRIVALVDGDPILLSDVDRAIGLGLLGSKSGSDLRLERRRVLDLLVEQRLRSHEIARYGFEEVSVQAIDDQVRALRSRFADDESFARRLAELGLDDQALRQLLARQLMTLAFVEERLGPRVFVGLDEIRRHYDEKLVPELHARGETAPPLENVREQIRALLKEQRLNEEIARWTSELRRQADVVDTLDREPSLPLPPLVPEKRP